ncbi:hypothetical protein GGS23DRAFT_560157 [Durotheca rogersii]|uniref:uncharacterized protein n=1 Tax=Durotheca rogersii TaxID=419775 RepID=UPI00221F000E|nr:uncharacterized protein GGS23DRAFT_560157 [Durotheca rogersii]KAI5865651.1 hypothetical protein GGS23DRAFT_560157 [Durotheca rogersii]
MTGCSFGVGQFLAQLIAKSSNRVVATAWNPASLSAITLTADNVLKIGAALTATLGRFDHIDVLVENLGCMLIGDTEAAGDEEARALIDTNLWGVVDM